MSEQPKRGRGRPRKHPPKPPSLLPRGRPAGPVKTAIMIRIPVTQLYRLRREAKRQKVAVSRVVQDIVSQWVAEHVEKVEESK